MPRGYPAHRFPELYEFLKFREEQTGQPPPYMLRMSWQEMHRRFKAGETLEKLVAESEVPSGSVRESRGRPGDPPPKRPKDGAPPPPPPPPAPVKRGPGRPKKHHAEPHVMLGHHPEHGRIKLKAPPPAPPAPASMALMIPGAAGATQLRDDARAMREAAQAAYDKAMAMADHFESLAAFIEGGLSALTRRPSR